MLHVYKVLGEGWRETNSLSVDYMNPISLKKGQAYTLHVMQSPTAQDTFWSTPGLISYMQYRDNYM